MPETPHRLPRTVIPSRYVLELTPDLVTATFSGSVEIDVEIVEPTSEIVLNAAELAITSARLVVDERRVDAVATLDPDAERGPRTGVEDR